MDMETLSVSEVPDFRSSGNRSRLLAHFLSLDAEFLGSPIDQPPGAPFRARAIGMRLLRAVRISGFLARGISDVRIFRSSDLVNPRKSVSTSAASWEGSARNCSFPESGG